MTSQEGEAVKLGGSGMVMNGRRYDNACGSAGKLMEDDMSINSVVG